MTGRIEHWKPGDAFRDFCQWDYDPVTPPDTNTLRQAALLWQSLALTDGGDAIAKAFNAIRAKWGPFNVVWGVKSGPQGLSWELYFYDYDRDQRRLGLRDLSDCLPGLVPEALLRADDWPWFMVSVEFSAATLAAGCIPCVDLYFEADGGTISAGQSEVWDGRSRVRKNDYHFYRSEPDRLQLQRDLADMPPLPLPFAPGRYGEEIFVISRKRQSSAAYFSRVDIRRTIAFAEEAGFDPRLIAFLRENSDGLAPFLFDTGIDYVAGAPAGRLLRSAIYGVM